MVALRFSPWSVQLQSAWLLILDLSSFYFITLATGLLMSFIPSGSLLTQVLEVWQMFTRNV